MKLLTVCVLALIHLCACELRTVVEWSRRLDTCDEQDRPIVDGASKVSTTLVRNVADCV